MTGNSVEKHCFIVLNIKSQIKLRFEVFHYLLKLVYTAFALNTTANTSCFARNVYIS